LKKKKKRRRLKKSVRRGCAILIAVPVLVCLVLLLKQFRHFRIPTDFESADTVALALEASELLTIHERVEQLFQLPQRLDTGRISLVVCDVATGGLVYTRHADCLVAPASCMKLLTAVAAMQFLGVDHQFVTEVTAYGQQQGETLQGDLYFHFDDDPLMESLLPVAKAVRQRGIRRVEGKVVLDLLRTDTLRAHPTAASWDIPYNRLPILLKGRPNIEKELRYLLPTLTSHFLENTASASTRHPKGELIYRHTTPLPKVLAPMLIHSSNIKADGLLEHLTKVENRRFGVELTPSQWLRNQATLVMQASPGGWTASSHHLDNFVLNDGSGLSPDNRLTALFLVEVLNYAWERESMRRILLDEALATPAHPVRHGSLLGRMAAPLYRNKIFVKTGTLTTKGVSSLAGYAQTASGRWLSFAIVNEDSPVAESRIFQDKLCKELVR